MRRLVIVFLLGASACWNFEKDFNDRCANDGFSDRRGCGGAATGGGDATGGGAATGGGEATGGGAAGGGGGALDAGRRICSAASWCWEHPAQTANSFYAVWGTDDELFVAGAGNSAFRLSNGEWSAQPLASARGTDGGPWAPEPVVTGSTVDDAGQIWLIGENMPLLVSDGGAFTVALAGSWQAITSWRGVVTVVRDTAPPRQVTVPGGSFGGVPANTSDPVAVYRDDEFCAVSASGPNGHIVYNCFDGGTLLDGRGLLVDGGNEAFAAILRRDAGLTISGGDDRLWTLADAGAVLTSYPFTSRVEASSQAPTGTFITGYAGFIFNVDTETSIRENNYSTLFAAWTSPQGTFWAAGEGGAVVRVTDPSTMTWESPSAPLREHFRAAWVDDTTQLGVGNNLIVVKELGSWTPRAVNDQHNWVAVARQGAVLYLLSQNGDAFSLGDNDTSPTALGTVAVPRQNFLTHTAAVGLTDAGVIFAAGDRISRLANNNSLQVLLDLNDAGQQFVSVATTTGLIAAATTDMVTTSSDNGATWGVAFRDGGSITDLSACPDGTIVIAGASGLLRRLSPDGGVGFAAPSISRPPLTTTISDTWCDPAGVVWSLTTDGLVTRLLTDGGVIREPTGWGHRTSGAFSAPFIGGNSRDVFILGSHAAVLSRPLP